jgi:uncharacterized membrane protein YoaK (UPF0700 family)
MLLNSFARFFQNLIGRRRTVRSNRQLGGVLSFVAGAINAGGFLAVQRYTSHMTGIVSGVADDLALGNLLLAAAGFVALVAFIAGAMTTAILVNWARAHNLHSEYASALLLEAVLLLLFGVFGANMLSFSALLLPTTVLLLCFIMGLQNAMVTKISAASIRTTHMTGVITDLGIELGRMLYWNRHRSPQDAEFVRSDQTKFLTHASILLLFFVGGLVGALSFRRMGFAATIPIAMLLVTLAAPPILTDIRRRARLRYSWRLLSQYTCCDAAALLSSWSLHAIGL